MSPMKEKDQLNYRKKKHNRETQPNWQASQNVQVAGQKEKQYGNSKHVFYINTSTVVGQPMRVTWKNLQTKTAKS